MEFVQDTSQISLQTFLDKDTCTNVFYQGHWLYHEQNSALHDLAQDQEAVKVGEGLKDQQKERGMVGVVVEWGEAGEGRSLICSKQELRHWRNSLRHLCVCVYVRLKLWVEQSRGVDATRRVNAC